MFPAGGSVANSPSGTLRTVVAAVLVLASAGVLAQAAEGRPPGRSDAGAASVASRPAGAGVLRVVLFWSPTCRRCDEISEALDACCKRWGDRILVEKRDLNKLANFREMMLFEDHYRSQEKSAPKLFVGGRHLAGSDAIVEKVKGTVAAEVEGAAETFRPSRAEMEALAGGGGPAAPELLRRFRGFGTGAVVVAGLLDGVNPCAFTTIVFLLSMLAYLGRGKNQMALVGAGFTAAVFGTYFLLGLGMLGAVKAFSVSHGVSDLLAYLVALLAFFLAAWSLVDFVRYTRTGDVKTVTLGLPDSIKRRIHKVVRVGLSTKGLLAGSIGVGFLVSLLESVCTGQVYLPTIVFVTRAPSMRFSAVGCLLLYNLAFIAPLVGILAVAYFGVRSERLGGFLRRRLGVLKLAMAILFAALGVLVLATV